MYLIILVYFGSTIFECYINNFLGVLKVTEEPRANHVLRVTTETGRTRVPTRWVRADSALATEGKRVVPLISHLEEWCAIVILDMVEDTAKKVSSNILIFAWHDLTMDFFSGGIFFTFACTFRCYIGTQCCV